MSKELQCPHCEEWCNPPEDLNEPDKHYEKECPHCGMVFGYTIYYIPHYNEYKVPCANGHPHDYKPMIGAPAGYFVGKVRCSYCGDETTVERLGLGNESV